jgi:hypothetical protein
MQLRYNLESSIANEYISIGNEVEWPWVHCHSATVTLNYEYSYTDAQITRKPLWVYEKHWHRTMQEDFSIFVCHFRELSLRPTPGITQKRGPHMECHAQSLESLSPE